MLAAVAVGAALLVVFVIVKTSGGGDDSSKLTVCERAWQEASRSISQAGPDNDTQVMVQPTLTACDNLAEWGAAKAKFGAKTEQSPAVIDGLCTRLGVSNRPLCIEAKQKAAPPAP